MFKGKLRSLKDKIFSPVVDPKVDNPPDEDEFFCEKCKGNHKLDSKIGKSHLPKEEKVEDKKEEEEKKDMKKKSKGFKNAILTVAAVVVTGSLVFAGVNAYQGQTQVVVEGDYIEAQAPVQGLELGAFSGTDVYSAIRFHAGFGQGLLATSTTGSAITLLEDELVRNDIFAVTSQTSVALAITMPATSTLSSILPNEGDRKGWTFRNNSTSTSAAVITLTAGAGWEFTGVDTNVDTIAADGWAYMDCYRMTGSSTFANMGSTSDAGNIHCGIQELVAAD